MIIKIIELLVLVTLAAISDLKTHKIKNKLILVFMILGLVTNLFLYGGKGAVVSSLGIVVPIVLLFFLYAFKMMGAADVKLFGAIGAIMGMKFALINIIFSILCGGIIAVILLIFRKNGIERLKYLFEYIKTSFFMMKVLPYTNIKDTQDGSKFHFAVSILCGTVIQLIVYKG